MSLEQQTPDQYRLYRFDELEIEDRWILIRLRTTVAAITRSLENYNPSQAIGVAREFFWSDFCDWYLEIVKPRLKGDIQDGRAAAVLAHCFDWVLRLLHPFVPFITEELWDYLKQLHPRRGIDSELHCGRLLIIAHWPEPPETWVDQSAEEEFELLQGVVRAIRNWRSENGFPPSRKIGAVIKAEGSCAAALGRVGDRIANLAGLDALEIVPDFERPKTAARIVHMGVEIFLLQVINLEDERRRMENSLKKRRKELEQIEKKLSSSGFISRAPEDVVSSERQRREAAAREIALLEQGLRDLDG
jgi:valyl-tRNA synthetase